MARFRLDLCTLLQFLLDGICSLRQGLLVRIGLAVVVGTAAVFALNPTIVLAVTSNCIGADGLSHPSSSITGYWYDQVQTGQPSVYTYNTEGGKANLTDGGNPSTNDNVAQHVLVALSSLENLAHCTVDLNKYPGCWIQVGWITGQDATCTGSTSTGAAIDLYVEIFDDSSSPCLEGTFGTPTSDASYDARYYSLVGSLHRYQAYYQPNNSSTIQVLAYGDFKDLKTAEIAGGEVRAPTDIKGAPHCPVLGQNTLGKWNVVGKTPSNSFASQVQLYTGSWVNWTTSVANPTTTSVNAPYVLQEITNFDSGDFSQWENGGS
jgi:hypothetical protein